MCAGTMTGSSLRMAALSSKGVLPVKGLVPMAISYSTTPRAQMSLDTCTFSPRSCSGDMYGSVPTAVPACVSEACDLSEGGRHVRVHGPLGEAEVEHLDPAVWRDDDVVALQVAMHDTTLVRVRECVGELPSVVHDIVRRHRSRKNHRAERLPLDELHRDVGLAVGFADFMHRADVGVIQCRRGARFSDQSCACRGIVEARGGKDFDGDVSIELLIAGAIHLSHATSAQSADDAVVRQPPAIHVAATSG